MEVVKENNDLDLAKKFSESKASKIKGDGQGKATFNDRILAIADFPKVIEHDKIYLGVAQELQNDLMMKEAQLSKKLKPFANDPKKRLDRIDKFIEWGKTRLEMYDVRGLVAENTTLINDKIKHYHTISLPNYNREVAEMNKVGFDNEYEFTNSIVNELVPNLSKKRTDKQEKELLPKMNDELYWWNKLEDKHKDHEEYKLNLFKALKRLNDKWREEESK